MLFFRSYARPGRGRSSKVVKPSRPGLERFSKRKHREFEFEIWRRRLGVSVQRVAYSVSISGPLGEEHAYLFYFSTADKAAEAARSWIDRSAPSRDPWEKWRQQPAKPSAAVDSTTYHR